MKTALPLALCASIVLAGAGTPDDEVAIDAPRAGWRHSAGERGSFVQPVHYPASSVNIEGASAAAFVAGRIAATGKAATLVVNGVPMPLQIHADGTFARPYAFGRGSNSVEVRPSGGPAARRQFYDAYADRTPVKLRVVLSWDTDGTDVDLHVVTPAGEHAFYGDRVTRSGGAIDVDVTTGFGPEIFAHPNPPQGVYHLYVNYYGAGQLRDAVTVGQVAIISNEGTPRERLQVFQVPLRRPGDLTLVRSFVYP